MTLNVYSDNITEPFFKISSINGKDFEYYKFESYLFNIEELVYQTLDVNSISENCTVYLVDNQKDLINFSRTGSRNWKLFLRKNYSEVANDNSISSQLFNILIVSALNLGYSKENRISFAWYISALNRKLHRLVNPIIYPENASFSAINFLLIQNFVLAPDRIINDSSMPDKDSVIYNFNSEAAEILLNTILSFNNGSKILKLFLKKCYTKVQFKNNINILYSILSKSLKLTKEEVKEEFSFRLNERAKKCAFNMFMPVTSGYIQEKFVKACIITYISEETGTNKECELENLSEVYDDTEPEYYNQIKQKLIMRFTELQRITPFFTKKPINGILEALTDYNLILKPNRFKEKIMLYRDEFTKAVIKEKNVQDFLRQSELKYVRIPVRYYYYFNVITDENSFQKAIWPDMDKYLTSQFRN